jgi:hypothetical protein
VEVYYYGVAEGEQDYFVYLQVENLTSATIDLGQYSIHYYFSHEFVGFLPSAHNQTNCEVELVDDGAMEAGADLWHAVITPASQGVPASTVSSMLSFRLHTDGTGDWANDYSYGSQAIYTPEPWLTTPVWRGDILVFGIPKL